MDDVGVKVEGFESPGDYPVPSSFSVGCEYRQGSTTSPFLSVRWEVTPLFKSLWLVFRSARAAS